MAAGKPPTTTVWMMARVTIHVALMRNPSLCDGMEAIAILSPFSMETFLRKICRTLLLLFKQQRKTECNKVKMIKYHRLKHGNSL